jgi:hypothetical protein
MMDDLQTSSIPLDPLLDARIEAICMRGCRQVRADIEILERGGTLPETRGLSGAQRDALLSELRAIMAVYGDRCRIDGTLPR